MTTCNRLEIYGLSHTADDAFGDIKKLFEACPELGKAAYVKYGEKDVFRHALRLAAGLESQIEGELQILSQLKSWRLKRGLPLPLAWLWDNAISLAGYIRATSGLDSETTDIASIVLQDLAGRLGREGVSHIAVIGTGNIAELVARYRPKGCRLTFVAHKNINKAESLAGSSNGEAIDIKYLPRVVTNARAIISATSSPHYILKKEHFADIAKRTGGELYLYDLAVPRDIDPEVRTMAGVLLQDLDDLDGAIKRAGEARRELINKASYLIEDAVKDYPGAAYEAEDQVRCASK